VRNSSNPVRVAPDSGRPAWSGRGLEELRTLRTTTRGTGRAALRRGALTCDDAQYRPHPALLLAPVAPCGACS